VRRPLCCLQRSATGCSFLFPAPYSVTSRHCHIHFACRHASFLGRCAKIVPVQILIGLCLQACEMFILELTLRSWSHSEENKRRTLQRNDIAAAITRTDVFDFLVRRHSLADDFLRVFNMQRSSCFLYCMQGR